MATDQIKVWADMRIRYSAALASYWARIKRDAVQLCDCISLWPSCRSAGIDS